nr:MAG TPA: hypothetical protein [Caudoviricetes sp.]
MLKAVGKFLWNNKINAGFAGWAGTDTYQTDREEGRGVAASLAHAGLEAALPFISMPVYLGYEVLSGAPAEMLNAYDAADKYRRQLAVENSNRAFVSSHFDDTEQTYTMRQRGMAIAQRSKYNVQQAMLGNEAKYMMK